MNRSISGPTLVALVVVASALLGLAVIESPAVALPFSIELVLLLALTLAALARERDRDIRTWLIRLALATLALRLLLVLFVQFRFSPYFFAPDAAGYENMGREIRNYWAGGVVAPTPIRDGWRPGYYHLNALFYSAFGDSRLALVVLNMFAGVWTALITFYLTRELLPVASAKVAALLTGVFPSLMLWLVLNIRDALATLCTVALVLYGMRLAKSFRPSYLWFFSVALLGLALLRDYMAFLVVLGIVIGSVTAIRPERMFGTMLFGTAAAVALTYFADRIGLFSTVGPEGLLETAQNSADWTTAGRHLGVRRRSGDPYDRRRAPLHTHREHLPTLRALPLGHRNHASGDGDGGSAPLVSSLPTVDSRFPNLPPRSHDHGAGSRVRPFGGRVELCPCGGELRDSVSPSSPDHAPLLHFFGHRLLLDQGPGHQPDAVVANEDTVTLPNLEGC